MLNPKDKRIARRFKTRLKKLTPLGRIMVYGSRARGDAAPGSDLDIFIEVPNLTPALRRKISELAWEIGFDQDIIISTFAVIPEYISEGPLGANPLVKAIERDGVPL